MPKQAHRIGEDRANEGEGHSVKGTVNAKALKVRERAKDGRGCSQVKEGRVVGATVGEVPGAITGSPRRS